MPLWLREPITWVLIRSAPARSIASICTMLDASTCRVVSSTSSAAAVVPVKASRSSRAIRYCFPIRTAFSRPSRT